MMKANKALLYRNRIYVKRNIEENEKEDAKNRSLFVYSSSMENIAIHLKYDRVDI